VCESERERGKWWEGIEEEREDKGGGEGEEEGERER